MKAGDVLVRIDPRDYEVAVAKAEADLRDAEAALESSRIDIPITTTNTASQLKTATSTPRRCDRVRAGRPAPVGRRARRLESAQAQVREAEANVKKTSDDVARYKLLVDKNEIPRQQYDTAVSAGRQRAGYARCAPGGGPRGGAEHRRGAERRGPGQSAHPAGGRLDRIRDDRAEAGGGQRSAREIRPGASGAEEGAARPGEAESQLLHDRRAGHRDRRQEDRGTGPEHFSRPAVDGGGSARRHLGHREFQGDAAEPHEAGPARPLQRGCVGQGIHRQGRGGRRRQRFALQPAAAGERDRQLRESGAAHSGSHQSRPGPERRSPPAPRHVGRSQGLPRSRSALWRTPRRSGNRNSIPG